MEIVIIGAGLTGLSAAWHLSKTEKQAITYEDTGRPGGQCRSIRLQGIRFDMGVHIFYFQQPDMESLFRFFMDGRWVRQEKKVKIAMGAYTVDYPYQANLYQLPVEKRIRSLQAFWRALSQKDRPGNFKQWLLANYGKQIAEDFLIPHNEKLMGIPLEEVSVKWAERFFPLPNAEEIIAGAFRGPDKHFHPNQFFYYPKSGGVGHLAETIADGLPVHYHHRLVGVDTSDRILYFENGHRETYEKLISTIPLPVLIDMMADKPPWLETVGKRLKYASLALVFIGLKRRPRFSSDGIHWLYYPQPEIPFQRLSFTENFSPANAPEKRSGLCLECPMTASKPPSPSLEKSCIEALERLGVCGGEEIMSVDSRFLKYAYPLYSNTWDQDMARVNDYLCKINIVSSGRYGQWAYSNMEDALQWGREAAKWGEESTDGGC